MTTTQGQKKHYTYIDLMRIIACIMVIIIHVTATAVVALNKGSLPQLLFIIVNRLAKPSVPLFIFISGYLTYRPGKLFNLPSKLKRLALPYIAWTCIYYALFAFKGIYPISGVFFFKHLILGDMMYHLYFMIILIELTMVTPFLLKISSPYKLLFTALSLQLLSAFIIFPLSDRLFITYIGYYGMGYFIRFLAVHDQTNRINAPMTHIATLILGAGFTASYYTAVNYSIYLPVWANSLLYMGFSFSTCLSIYLGCHSMKLRRFMMAHKLIYTRLGHATEHVYYAHPFGILFINYVFSALGILSISLVSVSAFVFICLAIVPLAYVHEKYRS